jgi:hypothetical protein
LPGESDLELKRRRSRIYMQDLRDRRAAEAGPKEPRRSKYGVEPRRPDESDEQYTKRADRERARAKRAIQRGIDGAPIADEEFIPKQKSNSPFTPEEYEALKRQPGESARDHRLRNQRARDRIYDERHPGERTKRAKQNRDASLEDYRKRETAYRAANLGQERAKQKRHYHAHKEKRLKLAADWRAKNPERNRERNKAWLAANPGLGNFYSAKWREACRVATPPWADFQAIRRFYEEAQRLGARIGIPHVVDHIIPLQGRSVRGLHVETNLRIITASENSRKHNAFDAELLTILAAIVVW